MTIRQTYKGTKHKTIYEAECKECGSRYEADKVDLTKFYSRNGDFIENEVCEECGNIGLRFSKKKNKNYIDIKMPL